MKTCTKCLVEQPYDCFHKGHSYKDGHRSVCKSCTAKKHSETYVKKTPEYFEEKRRLRELEKAEIRSAMKALKDAQKAERQKLAEERRKERRKQEKITFRKTPFARRAERNNAKHGTTGKLPANIVATLLVKQFCQCAYCNINILSNNHLDHKIPVSRGGTNTEDNVHLTCPGCNIRKGQMTHEEFLMASLPDFLT